MNKERRLGRGLEALLGHLPPRHEAAKAEQAAPAVQDQAAPAAPAAPSAEALFRLDVPHAAPGQSAAQPHRPPGQAFAMPAAPAERLADVPSAAKRELADGMSAAKRELADGTPATSPGQDSRANAPLRVNIQLIDSNPAQPRQDFAPEEMKSLAESISAHGLLQPVVVRRVHNRYQLVAGERRLRAASQAGWIDVPVNVIEADDRQMAELAIVENLQRKDLNALEKAASFQKYLDEYGCTQEELAGRLKLDRSTIANLIRLLELPEAVQDAIRRGKITQGHARALLPLGDEREQIEFCGRIQREGLNVRQTEVLVQETIDAADHEPLADAARSGDRATTGSGATGRSSRAKSEQVIALEQEFRRALGMKVKITHNARGRGKLVVQFRNHEEFERLKKHVCG